MGTNQRGEKGYRAFDLGALRFDGTISFDTSGIATGVTVAKLPAGAIILPGSIWARVVTPFNAGTTNVFTLGYGASLDEIIDADDIDETSATFQKATTGEGLIMASTTLIKAKYTQSGTAATAGVVRFGFMFSDGTRVFA